jgi:hypothetical protein
MRRIFWTAAMFAAMCAVTVAVVAEPLAASALQAAPSIEVYKNAG